MPTKLYAGPDFPDAALPLTGTEEVLLNVGGVCQKSSTQDIADLASSGSGDVVGPATATADAVALYDGTTGKLLKNGVTVAQIKQIEQNSQSAAYGLVLSDAGKHIYHPSADTTARIWTIPANASVAFPIGTAITFVNDTSAGIITLAITTDTLAWFPSGSTGSRAIAPSGCATALKVTSTRWVLTGVGIT